MLKEKFSVLRKMMITADLVLISVCFFAGWVLADRVSQVGALSGYLIHLPFYLLLWSVMLRSVRVYESFRVKDTFDILLSMSEGLFFSVAFFGAYLYLFRIESVNAGFLLYLMIATAFILCLEKIGLIYFFRYVRSKGFNFRVLLIVGTGERAAQFVSLVNQHREWGYRVLGLIDEKKEKADQEIEGVKVIGSFADLPGILHNNVVDQVMFIVPRSWLGKIEPLMKFCELEGTKVSIAVDYFAMKLAKAKPVDISGFPFLSFETTPDKPLQLLIKNTFDALGSLIALILLAPLLLIIALLVKLTSPGPVIFTQERCGMNGRKFRLIKFRTMVADAETQLARLLEQNEMCGPAFKMADDPRITKVGRFLRKFSLDELPQLWNVFKGDMSLVGPRPPLPEEVEKYDNWQRRRLSMRPGLTCIWQVSGRNKIKDFDQWMKLDLKYIDEWSLALDFRIFLKTVPVVLLGIGAK